MNKIFHILCTILLFFSLPVYGQGLLTKQESLPCLDKKFTIVAHIVRDTFMNEEIMENEISAAIPGLNQAFAPICVSFEICEFRYIDNFQYDEVDNGITGDDWDEMQIKYHQKNRINVFYVSGTGTLFRESCGFATQEGITIVDRGGIVISKNCVEGNGTLPHEFGHYFGLLDTYLGNGSELVDGSNCETEGDLLCDTPADPYFNNGDDHKYTSECTFISDKIDANGQFYEPDVGNFMNHYGCSCSFTFQQFSLMAETYLSVAEMW